MSLSSANGKDPSIRDKKEPPLFKSAAALTKRIRPYTSSETVVRAFTRIFGHDKAALRFRS
jgi:hypothetical protein